MPDLTEISDESMDMIRTHLEDWNKFDDSDKIIIRVNGRGDLETIKFLMRAWVPFWKVKQAYADLMGVKKESLTFLRNMKIVGDNSSPASLRIASGDGIGVFMHD